MTAASGVTSSRESGGRLVRWGLALANWSEQWFPDPFVFALLGVAVVFAIGVLAGESPSNLAIQAGKSFWSLVQFTMQMVMVIIGGYVVSSTPAVSRAIRALARVPKSPKGAVAFVAFLSMASSLISWGLSLVFSGLFVRELAKQVKGLDYRAAGAAGYLGIGTVWALGFSSSAAMLMATKSSLPPTLLSISGVIPLTQTIFLWPSLLMTLVLMTVSISAAYLSAPTAEKAKTVQDFGIELDDLSGGEAPRTRPGEWLEYSPILTIPAGVMLTAYLVNVLRTSPQGALAALDLNTYNLIFLTAGLLLQWRPRRFVRAVNECVPGTAGILIQFPIYAMIFGMIVGTGLSDKAAHLLVSVSTHTTYPLLVALYSATLGVFIPSGGSKWVIESPYVLQAAIQHHVHLGWVVQIYNASEALPNLINPFYMLPLLGILRLRARDLVGYTILQLGTQIPIVFLLCWLFAQYIPFVPPVK
ncbi:MAG TPA: TIGR00366 family protein [Bryobacteraceae bacterium]|nr:TIGR00366 family protein [Bryobacteraceae bacterium]